ncbi:hypothetical protein ACQPVP_01180 [Clostridium nigeriense]|uniref:hypothetical protein n=1 Tax=Clostridium nigeriense TaxID=1805470 RepID=UPI003D356A0B
MTKKSRRQKIIRIRKIIITILIIILSLTLIISYINYKNTLKKVGIKYSIRELILTVETVEIKEPIDIEETDTISNIKSENGSKLQALEKYSDIDDFNRIESLTIGDARKILNNEVDFEIDSEGKFENIK